MFGLFRKNKTVCTDIADISEEERKEQENGASAIGAGYAAAGQAQQAVQQAAKTFAKPETYTGNRKLYDSQTAKRMAKKKLFQNSSEVYDPYTGKKLVLTKNEAKALYGEDWGNHFAESDHIKSLERIYDDTKNDVWNTTNDIRAAANSDDNIQVASHKFNNAKRSRTNQEYVENEEYLREKGVELTEEGKRKAIRDGKAADKSIHRQLKKSGFKNMVKTGHEAGKLGAYSAGVSSFTISGIRNLVDVIKGEKDVRDAVADTAADGGKAAVSGYVMSSGLTVVSHSLSSSSSKFIQGLAASNVPGKVITALAVTGDTLKRYGEGEITTQECLIELGDKGLNLVTAGYAMAAGQALIPIPVVGAAVGALAGSVLTSTYYNELIHTLQVKEMEHQERLRIIEECHRAAQQTIAFREELEFYLQSYFREYRDCFDSALSSMRFAYQAGDADGMIAGANDITRKLGGNVYYETAEEFKNFLSAETADVL